jgi:hypothetical protein
VNGLLPGTIDADEFKHFSLQFIVNKNMVIENAQKCESSYKSNQVGPD